MNTQKKHPSIKKPFRRFFQWLIPGLGVKRWLIILLFGITLIALGLALFVFDVYRNTPQTWWLPIITTISLQELPRLVRVAIFGTLGISMVILGFWGINRSLLVPFLRPGVKLVDQVADYRRRERGPKVVVLGGGHGVAAVLRGLKDFTQNLTAIVSVADDGGSSGELRRSLGILPPGDIRNCLAALSDDEALLAQLFQFRFREETGLGGHSFGNLFISALAEVTGSFENAIAESGRALSVHGQVLPSTLHNVRLSADVQFRREKSEIRVEGESCIPNGNARVRRIWLEPDNATGYPPALGAILMADLIIIGPGSLYTSILPNLLVQDIRDAIRSSKALKIFIANLVTQAGETDGYTCVDHCRVVEDLIGADVIDIIVCNSCYDETLPDDLLWVRCSDDIGVSDQRIYATDLIVSSQPDHHDAKKLARVIMNLFNERTGPLIRDATSN